MGSGDDRTTSTGRADSLWAGWNGSVVQGMAGTPGPLKSRTFLWLTLVASLERNYHIEILKTDTCWCPSQKLFNRSVMQLTFSE